MSTPCVATGPRPHPRFPVAPLRVPVGSGTETDADEEESQAAAAGPSLSVTVRAAPCVQATSADRRAPPPLAGSDEVLERGVLTRSSAAW